MEAPVQNPALIGFITVVFLTVAVFVYSRVAIHLVREGGRVRTGSLAFPELLMSIVLITFFGLLMTMAILRQNTAETELKIDAVLPSSMIFLALTVGIGGFVKYRGMRLREVFGIDRLGSLATAGWAIGLILAAFPLAGMANVLSMAVLKDQFTPQPLVQLFSDVSRHADYSAIAKIFISGVLIQPACEEFLFRGFFYGVGKNYIGALPAGCFCSLLFAAFHTNLPAFAGLLVLAVCLNLAYERTGSLLVPIGMHAIFNFTSLSVLFLQAQMTAPA